ncbi:hypothetical protein Krac_0009 [Ktedonobacter racemifer DSM 44963]|uniref:Uncharacterized protein n=1 Tax=Ktedonobacter racemifer DSM 44963 TaxID=485913 RepID=D6U8V2_KTERA|nr:hypothetical protein Krac_0009 [Ktedonobacter racemifer DSM 44963]
MQADVLVSSALQGSHSLASCLQGGATVGACGTFFLGSLLPIGEVRCQGRLLEELSFQSTHALSYSLLNLTKGGFGVGKTPFFHATEHLCAQFLPTFFQRFVHGCLLFFFSLSYHLLSPLPISLQKIDVHQRAFIPCKHTIPYGMI